MNVIFFYLNKSFLLFHVHLAPGTYCSKHMLMLLRLNKQLKNEYWWTHWKKTWSCGLAAFWIREDSVCLGIELSVLCACNIANTIIIYGHNIGFCLNNRMNHIIFLWDSLRTLCLARYEVLWCCMSSASNGYWNIGFICWAGSTERCICL